MGHIVEEMLGVLGKWHLNLLMDLDENEKDGYWCGWEPERLEMWPTGCRWWRPDRCRWVRWSCCRLPPQKHLQSDSSWHLSPIALCLLVVPEDSRVKLSRLIDWKILPSSSWGFLKIPRLPRTLLGCRCCCSRVKASQSIPSLDDVPSLFFVSATSSISSSPTAASSMTVSSSSLESSLLSVSPPISTTLSDSSSSHDLCWKHKLGNYYFLLCL